MTEKRRMKLVLEDGTVFEGIGSGAGTPAFGEIVFNTSMVGYQEIISDPAYVGQIVVMTYPLMGQYGITDEDSEARNCGVAGLVVKECCETPSNFRFTKTLSEELEERGVPCISDLDTRMLTRIIRENSALKAAIVPEDFDTKEAVAKIKENCADKNPVAKASCRKRWFSRTPHHAHDVVIVDFGLKKSIVNAINQRGCNVTVMPYDSTIESILATRPEGVLLSSGPGDPRELKDIIKLAQGLIGKVPVFGIGLGHHILAMAYGASIRRMKCGHHGGHPVRNLESGKIITVEHNHDYEIDPDSIGSTGLEITYVDAADATIEGIRCAKDKVSSVQFYPEGCPGPQESDFLDTFIKAMED